MSMDYIKKYYGVPAKKGAEILFSGPNKNPVKMKIIGSKNQYLKCLILDGSNAGLKTLIHPKWGIKYL